MNFENKICVVTGSTSGIGLGIAEYLLERGAVVYVSGRTAAHMDNAKAKLARFGSRAHYELFDLCESQKAEDYVKAIGNTEGRIDYVFANAGGGTVTPFEQITWEMWSDIIGSNLTGVAAILKGAVPFMKEQRDGHIIITASIAAFSANPYQVSYVATKHAAYGIAEALHYELEEYNIQVKCICPAFVRTPIFTRNGEPEVAIPPQCISIDQALEEIFAGLDEEGVPILVCDEARDFYTNLRTNPSFCDNEMRNLAKFYSLQLQER